MRERVRNVQGRERSEGLEVINLGGSIEGKKWLQGEPLGSHRNGPTGNGDHFKAHYGLIY